MSLQELVGFPAVLCKWQLVHESSRVECGSMVTSWVLGFGSVWSCAHSRVRKDAKAAGCCLVTVILPQGHWEDGCLLLEVGSIVSSRRAGSSVILHWIQWDAQHNILVYVSMKGFFFSLLLGLVQKKEPERKLLCHSWRQMSFLLWT